MTNAVKTRTHNFNKLIRRISEFVLLFLFFHAIAWQTVHVHNSDHSIHCDYDSAKYSETAQESTATVEAVDHHHHSYIGECVICRLQQQFISISITSSPSPVAPPLESETTSDSVFFGQKFYRSTETAPVGGRGPPPASFLS